MHDVSHHLSQSWLELFEILTVDLQPFRLIPTPLRLSLIVRGGCL